MAKIQDLDHGYTKIGNTAVNDPRLSLKAKGLLLVMLSKPDTWEYNAPGLAKSCKDSLDGIRSGLKELEALGYLKRTQQTASRGRFGKMVYEICDSPCRDFPYTDKPYTEKPSTVKPHQVITNPVTTNPVTTNPVISNSCNCSFPPEAGKTAADDVCTESNNFSSESWRTGWDDLHLEMFDIYRECCPNLQPCFKMTDSLAEAMDVFLNSRNYEIDDWACVCEEANRTGFLVGLNDKGFKAGIFFLLKPQTFRKVTEGWYDRKSRAERAKTMEGRQLDEDELRAIQEALSQE